MSTTKISQHVIGSGAITAAHVSNITTANITENTNLYHTSARARGAISVTGGYLSYDSGTGVIQLTFSTPASSSNDTTPATTAYVTSAIGAINSFTGTIGSSSTATTQSASDNTTKLATTAFVGTAITNVIGGAPGTLDTLNELAAAINDDASYASTLTTALATKAPLASPTFTTTITTPDINITGGSQIGQDYAYLKSNSTTNASLTLRKDSTGADSIDFLQLRSDGNGLIGKIEGDGDISFKAGTFTGNITAPNLIASTSVYSNNGVYYGATTLNLKDSSAASFLSFASNKNATFAGNIEATGSRTIAAQFDSQNYMQIESNNAGGVLKGLASNVTGIMLRSYGDSFFVNNVGIGATSPEAQLELYKTVDGDAQNLLIMNQKTYGSGTGTNERASINLGIAEASQTSLNRLFGTMHVRTVHEGTSANGILSFGVRGASAIRDDVLVLKGLSSTDTRVGINLNEPTAALEINRGGSPYGMILGSSQGAGRVMLFKDNNASPSKYNWLVGSQYNVDNGFEITPSTVVGGFTFSVPSMVFTTNGNVGINCSAPEEKLTIDGGVKIANSNKRLYFGTEGGASHRALEGQVDGSTLQVGEGYGTVLLGSASAKVGIRQNSPDAMLHIDGATSSIAGLIIEGNTNGDVISLQLKAKANNGTLSYHGLTASPGSDQDDNTIALGNGAGNGVVVDHQNVATARYIKSHGGGTYSYDVGGSYIGANGADFGTHAIFRTPSVTSPSSGSVTTQFLTTYSSGHWGEYPICRFRVYGTYFNGSYREYLFRMQSSVAYLQEVELYASNNTWGASPGTITKASVVDTGTDHSGQNIYKCELSFTTGGAYYRNYVVTEINYGANTYYSSGTSVSTVDGSTNGGKYHFKTISSAEGRGYFV